MTNEATSKSKKRGKQAGLCMVVSLISLLYAYYCSLMKCLTPCGCLICGFLIEDCNLYALSSLDIEKTCVSLVLCCSIVQLGLNVSGW